MEKEFNSYVEGMKDGIQAERDGILDKEFNLGEHRQQHELGEYCFPEVRLREFIKLLGKECWDAQMYADMDEDDFWATSTISPQEAQKRADYFFEFLEKINKLAGKDLI